MSKVRNFSKIAPNMAFPEFNFYELCYSTFESSELDRMKKLLPLREMAKNFGLVRKSMKPKLGRKSFFTPEGKVALMFLKMYTGLSCPKLLELARVMANVMEGSFGTQKKHYDLRRVKSRTKRTKILYIFFGIHAANAVQLADRVEQRARLVAA